MSEDMTKVDENYEPSVKLKKFVSHYFASGSKTEAEKHANIKRQTFYKHLKDNEKFRQWYNAEVDTFTDSLIAKALSTLNEILSNSDNAGAKVSAIRTILEMAGRIRTQNNNVVNFDNRILPAPVTQFTQININKLDEKEIKKELKTIEALGIDEEEITEIKQLMAEVYPEKS